MRIRKGFKHLVNQYSLNNEFIKTWDSATDAAKYFKTSQGNISNAARGERNNAQGFIWKYVEEKINPLEIWKKHPFHEIEGSNFGRIKIDKNHVTKGQGYREGYLRCKITNKSYSVHRLIGECWFYTEKLQKDLECNNRSEINHKNRIRSDNNIVNLEWVTPRENSLHKYKK